MIARDRLVHRPADHQLRKLRRRCGGRVERRHELAGAQHGNAVGYAQHLGELVADEDDRQAVFDEARERREQRGSLLRRQHRRWLVENQDPRIAIERLQYLDALPLADRKPADTCIRVDEEAEPLGGRDELCPGARAIRAQRPQRLRAEHHVVLHGKVVGQREMLVNHADAGGECCGGVAGRELLAEYLDRAGVGDVVAEKDRNQRRLAGAVLAQQGKDFAAPEIERNPVVCDDVAKALGDPGEAQYRRRGVLCVAGASGHFAVDFGSVSITATLNLPSRISFSFTFTRACRSAGTLLANVPSGASSEPLCFISEY